jgi:hypothetical protein
MSEVKVNKISPRTNCGTVTVGDAGDSVTVTAGVPVTVNGDLKSNALKAVDGGSIISQCGTNITLGASGDTINLAAGASVKQDSVEQEQWIGIRLRRQQGLRLLVEQVIL